MPPMNDIELPCPDLSERALYRDGFPHAVFDRLRRDAPVFKHAATPGVMERIGEPFWVVSRFEDVRTVSRDTATYAATDGPAIERFPEDRRNNMIVSMDPPDHRRLRGLISKGFFLPRMVDQLEGRIRDWARRIVDDALERGEVDFVADIAYRLPMNIIGDLVGIPDSDREHLFECVNRMMLAGEPSLGITPEQRDAVEAEIFTYGIQLAEEKRRHPADDVWSVLTQATLEDEQGDAGRLSDWELALFFMVLVVAGSETTRNALSAGFLAFIDNPDQLARFQTAPELHDSAAEEVLRWTSPVLFFARTATRETELAGERIAAGDRVSIWYPSANRDEAEFIDPHRFDIGREPNRQTAFGGGGPHLCLGSHLARRQLRTLFGELFDRAGEFEVGPTHWYVSGLHNNVTCSLAPFQVALRPR
jgi:cytochrome P450